MRLFEGSSADQLDKGYLDFTFRWLYQIAYDMGRPSTADEAQTDAFRCVDGGNYRLIESLARPIQESIHYNMPLTGISKGPNGTICLQFRDGSVVLSNCVILALPCSTLRDVSIEEGILPRDQTAAIYTLQYGSNAKVLLPVSLQDPGDPSIVVTENMCCWFNHDRSVMTWYYGGEPGDFNDRSMESLQEHINKDLPTVRAALPNMQFTKGTVPEPRCDALVTQYSQPIGISWIHEEFSKGSYSNFGVDQWDSLHEMTTDSGETVRKVFRSVQGKLFFAGEHTAVEYPATMEGAVESGERTARIIQKFYPLL